MPRKRQRVSESLLDEYRSHHVAVARKAADTSAFGAAQLKDIIFTHADAVAKGWCQESGAAMPSPSAFAATTGTSEPCYTSFVVNSGAAVEAVVAALPIAAPEGFDDVDVCRHMDRAWVFAGRNGKTRGGGGGGGGSLAGRAEHTDDVAVAGTWHVQLRGTKLWSVRPCLGARGAPWGTDEALLPPPRTILCEPGDVLVINTRTWWHATEIPLQEKVPGGRGGGGGGGDDDAGLSSIARDFVWRGDDANEDGKEYDDGLATNIDGVYATVALAEGDVALLESDLPDCALPRSEDPNCQVQEEINTGDGVVQAGLVAIRPIAVGECFTVAPSSDDEEGGEDDDDDDDDEGDEDDSGAEGLRTC